MRTAPGRPPARGHTGQQQPCRSVALLSRVRTQNGNDQLRAPPTKPGLSAWLAPLRGSLPGFGHCSLGRGRGAQGRSRALVGAPINPIGAPNTRGRTPAAPAPHPARLLALRARGALQTHPVTLLPVGGLVALEALIWLVNIALDELVGQSVAALCVGMIAGRLRRISPQTTRHHESNRGNRPANRDITVKPAGPGGPFAAMTRDHGRLSGKSRTRRAAEPSARSTTGTPNTV